ncbi:SHOCT domain-containing protein [Streptomyces sp. BE147]|uniref:SHOCT domain-containing protein n=1 Tax=Streptomyces sp. BE147 TaxID=3002524 RepID=UPI002E767E4E|nr:SHOCT domain-containing protein [Streptomyces sp. BE147]MEE1740575.1 SHOCT domain-containing protein [Streptomyces sp. BE147]
MNTLAYNGGPGPWILLFPIIWAAVVVGAVTLLRRTGWRGGRGPWQAARTSHTAPGEPSPIALLGRRFATGEIDEDEYWRRLSVLDEQFGPGSRGGAV